MALVQALTVRFVYGHAEVIKVLQCLQQRRQRREPVYSVQWVLRGEAEGRPRLTQHLYTHVDMILGRVRYTIGSHCQHGQAERQISERKIQW